MSGLRSGFTTGTAAAAAAMSAATLLFRQIRPDAIAVPLPPLEGTFATLRVPIEKAGLIDGCSAFAEVRKDGGDDPDATHGMIIRADIYREVEPGCRIDGGQGIGRVALRGLPVAPGEAAINPVPRQQIAFGLASILPDDAGLKVIISAPEGQERAKKTMNARLGIIGGISILGTQGIVRPYSHIAYKAAIEQAVSVARASACDHLCFATGRRSLAFLAKLFPDLTQQSFIVAGDFVRASLSLAKDFKTVSWGCLFGKLVKLAQGLANTHAHANSLDLKFLASILHRADIGAATTAQSVLSIAQASGSLMRLMHLAKSHAEYFAQRQITIHLFDTAGRELARV